MAAPDAGKRIEAAGDRVMDAADAAANRGIDGVQPLLDFQLLRMAGLEITVGGLLAALLALVLVWSVSMLLRRALKRYGDSHQGANRATLYTLSRLLHYLLLAIGVLLALELAGIPLGKFTLFAGALGVGLGFGLQAIFSNFISGLILLFDKSLKVGDFVELASGVHGEVRDIKIRATTIVTNDNIDILVPNSEFVSGRVVNWTYRDVSRRIRVPFVVAYGTDKELVKKAALEAAAEVPFTLDLDGARKPQVWLVEFGTSSLKFELVTWLTAEATKRPAAVQAAYLWALDTALHKYAIEIPFPQQDLHIRSLFGRVGDDALRAWSGRESPDAPPARECHAAEPGLDDRERVELAGNDAQREVQRQIAQDEALAASAGGTAIVHDPDIDTDARDRRAPASSRRDPP